MQTEFFSINYNKMKITKEQIDNVNAVLSVSIEKADYSQKVENALNNYKKNASVPGFRKGHIPMGMIYYF